MRQIALSYGFVFLLFVFDRLRVERGTFILAVLDTKMLGGMTRLFEGFRDHESDGLAPVADGCRFLLRSLVCRTLCRTRSEKRIIDNGDHARHGQCGFLVDRCDFAARDRGGDQHPFRAIGDRIFGSIGRGAGNLRQSFDAGQGLPQYALLHIVEAVGLVGLVLFEMHSHAAPSVACSRTA